MASVVTLIDTEDDIAQGGVQFIRKTFLYTRDSGDDALIVVTPTAGTAKVQHEGLIEAPWAGIFSLSATNKSAGIIQPVLPPALVMSANRASIDIPIDTGEGELVDLLPGEAQTWLVSFPIDSEQVRCYPAGTQAAGGRVFWTLFASQNGVAATWEITLTCQEAA